MNFGRIASVSMKHRRIVVAAWLAILVAGFVAAPGMFERLTSEAGHIDDSETSQAQEAIYEAAPSGDEIYAVADGRSVDDPGLRASVERTAAEVLAIPGVAEVLTPWSGSGPGAEPDLRAVAVDGRAAALVVHFDPTPEGESAVEPTADLLHTIDAPRVLVGGGDLLDSEMDDQAASDLAKAEMLSMPVVLALLVLVFGGLVAAGMPLLVTIIGIGSTLGMLSLVSTFSDVSVYAVNIVTMLGLGLAVDYALLVVSRFREERAHEPDVQAAVVRTMSTAGRTVAFSGLTVAASLAGLLVFPDVFLRSAGLGGLAVVLLGLAATLTLLPALLASFGHRVRAAKPGATDRGLFVTVSRLVSRRPVRVIAVVVPVLLLAAMPFLDVRFAEPDGRSLSSSSENRQLYELADERFDSSAEVDPITVVARGSIPEGELSSYVASLGQLPDVRTVTVRPDVPDLTVIDIMPEGENQGEQAMRLVDEVRAADAPVPVQVTGDSAELTDYQDVLIHRTPVALGVIALATFLLLFLFTGSVVLPIKALVMNVLSLGASFGALVWVFQEGNLGGLVGTEALGSLSITTPVLMFAIAFGLSMDYEVFLLGRISEAWRRTGDNDGAVAEGLQRTGRVVTTAALLMSVVFAGFVSGGFSPVKQVGLGLLLAVVVDATLVRMLLMPAAMSLMGRWNWWAPRPLRRLHRRVGFSEEMPPAAVAAASGISR